MVSLWPFVTTNTITAFVQAATPDINEVQDVVFHFIVAYDAEDRVPLLINQQIVSVDAMQMDPNGACEYLAFTVPEGEHVSSIVGHLGGAPFWHRYARMERVYPHNTVNGVRMLDVNRN